MLQRALSVRNLQPSYMADNVGMSIDPFQNEVFNFANMSTETRAIRGEAKVQLCICVLLTKFHYFQKNSRSDFSVAKLQKRKSSCIPKVSNNP